VADLLRLKTLAKSPAESGPELSARTICVRVGSHTISRTG
jgi:hypothetical protein